MNTTTIDSRLSDWQAWREERQVIATGPFGLASVTGTHWLDDVARPIDGLPGTWSLADVPEVGAEEPQVGEGRKAVFVRRGADVALRVFDPQAVDVDGVDAFDFDPDWVLHATFVPASDDAKLPTQHVDGGHSEFVLAGHLEVVVDGQLVRLAAFDAAGRLHVVFADASNGNQTQQFRFLFVERPQTGDDVELDFNRAVLPPCAFTEHYLCPLPPSGNRLAVPVLAGEKAVRRRA